MSAHMCSGKTLSVLTHAIVYARSRMQLDHVEPHAIYRELIKENVASLHYRYPSRDPEQWLPAELLQPGLDVMRTYSAVELVKLAHYYRYQACEHPGFGSSRAFEYICQLAFGLTVLLAETVLEADYNAARWGL